MRCIQQLSLKLEGVTALIGENGSGKSTIIEACEILKRAADRGFGNFFHSIHGGWAGMGSDRVALGADIESRGQRMRYDFAIRRSNSAIVLESESLSVSKDGENYREIVKKSGNRVMCVGKNDNEWQGLTHWSEAEPNICYIHEQSGLEEVRQAVDALRHIECHVPLDISPSWVSRTVNRGSLLRDSVLIEPTEGLNLLGRNLANVYHALKNESGTAEWGETLDWIRLGLGDDIEDVGFGVDPAGGRIALRVKYTHLVDPVPAAYLSDGTLAYLAIVAMARAGRDRSLLAFDEPDLHLHPHLLARVLGFFETLSRSHPVILASHSDRLLDQLDDPVQSAVLCDLDEEHHTRLLRPNRQAYEKWIERYRGLGDIRAEGHEESVMTEES
ncbi:MAG: ATP-binding protein [Deltaproteobacteria bacterium]|nr:ATP-binding protein [Deltaproteobacteria bacterium]